MQRYVFCNDIAHMQIDVDNSSRAFAREPLQQYLLTFNMTFLTFSMRGIYGKRQTYICMAMTQYIYIEGMDFRIHTCATICALFPPQIFRNIVPSKQEGLMISMYVCILNSPLNMLLDNSLEYARFIEYLLYRLGSWTFSIFRPPQRRAATSSVISPILGKMHVVIRRIFFSKKLSRDAILSSLLP